MNSSGDDSTSILYDITFIITVCGSVLSCLAAAILVFVLKLYRRVVYRLALYQVLASLAFAIVEVLQAVLIDKFYSPASCAAIGWLTLYAQWMKLLFTAWVTLHIFCFGVFRKTLKLEVLYVATSLIVPAVIASVPLVTSTYGPMRVTRTSSLCYIFGNETKDIAAVERLVLWDVPALITLFAASIAMISMVLKLTNKVCRSRLKYTSLDEGDQFSKALRHLIPLAAFPILFFVFIIPQLALNIFLAITTTPSRELFFVALTFISLWSLASGVTLIVHITIAKCFPKMRKQKRNTAENISLYTSHSSSTARPA
eukprot:Em0005g762a